MKSYEIYNLIVCLIVFTLLTGLLSYLIVSLIRLTLRAIRAGMEDAAIRAEYEAEQNKKHSRFWAAFDRVFPAVVCALLGVALVFSLYSRFTANGMVGAIPTVKVVETGSMEYKHKNNTYLFDNNLDDQIATYDLIVLHQLPKEEDLRLYDIVVYEVGGFYIVHRIVGIEEPNEQHPNCRYFLLQGDANTRADDFPVTYEQMTALYRGEHVPFIGTFVFFMQSPAGMLCFLLVVFAVIATPIAEKKLEDAKRERLALMMGDKPPKEE